MLPLKASAMRANRVWQLSHPYSGKTSRHAKFIDSTEMVDVGVGGGVGGGVGEIGGPNLEV